MGCLLAFLSDLFPLEGTYRQSGNCLRNDDDSEFDDTVYHLHLHTRIAETSLSLPERLLVHDRS